MYGRELVAREHVYQRPCTSRASTSDPHMSAHPLSSDAGGGIIFAVWIYSRPQVWAPCSGGLLRLVGRCRPCTHHPASLDSGSAGPPSPSLVSAKDAPLPVPLPNHDLLIDTAFAACPPPTASRFRPGS